MACILDKIKAPHKGDIEFFMIKELCMSENKLQAIILAAGRSTRFNTGKSKLAEKICGQEMVLYATTLLEKLHIDTTVVVGHDRESIQEIITRRHGSSISFEIQSEQKGTGHALFCTKDRWDAEHILVINGDTPLITQAFITQLIDTHTQTNAAITFIIAHNTDPELKGYGRIITDDTSVTIVEAKEYEQFKEEACCINAGIYIFKKSFLEDNIHKLEQSIITKELYITDLIKIASDQELMVKTVNAPFDTIRGVNDFKELWAVEQIKRSSLITYWMEQGVRFHAAQNVHIDVDVMIGAGSHISSGVNLLHGSRIGTNCHIEPFSIISNTTIGNNVTIFAHSVITDSTIHNSCQIGPFAHIEGNSIIEEKSIIGNFVQVKKSSIGKQSKAKHLTFLGNAIVGNKVNVGAGTITCNYDGVNKHATVIKDEVFIGSNNTLVAPLTIEKESYTAAGSVITNHVPPASLAIGRARQINKEGYAKKIKDRTDSPFIAAVKTTKSIEGA